METLTIPTDFTEASTLSAERVTLTVGTYAPDRGRRRFWHYYVAVEGTVVHEGDDLSGYGSAAEAMETLTSFLGAWVESVEWADRNGQAEGENSHLFPAALYPLVGAEVEDLVFLSMGALGWLR